MDARIDNHVYTWEEVVIGNNLASFVYAKKNNCKLIVNGLEETFQFEIFRDEETLQSLEYDTMIANKKTLIDQLLFDLCLDGKAPINRKVDSIRIEPEDNLLSIIISDTTRIKVHYTTLRIFDDNLISGLPFNITQKTDINIVYDWFKSNINREVHFLELFNKDSALAKKVIIRKKPENLVITQSFLTDKQLKKFDFSDTMSRFSAERTLKKNELRGPRNGFYRHKPDVPRYRPIKLDFMKREIMPQRRKEFIKFGNITFDNKVL